MKYQIPLLLVALFLLLDTATDSTAATTPAAQAATPATKTAQALTPPPNPYLPSSQELNRSFGNHDRAAFAAPSKVHYPQTWFHYIGGNVAKEGITADLEAIAAAGISGIQLFHGQFGGPWPGVEDQIACLSPLWEDALRHTAHECQRLGLRFTMQNCPGWAMSGGPWIEPSNAMRHLAWSRTDVVGGSWVKAKLPVDPSNTDKDSDYHDIAVLAFPTPLDNVIEPLTAISINSDIDAPWPNYLLGSAQNSLQIPQTTADKPHWIELTFSESTIVRTVEFPCVQKLNHGWCYDPGVSFTVQAVMADGSSVNIVDAQIPQSSWQDDRPLSFACTEVSGAVKYRVSFINKHHMSLPSLRFFTAARKNSWESEAGWTLRGIERTGANSKQSPLAYIDHDKILDISQMVDSEGNLNWKAPAGKWTVLRIGHVNAKKKNGPAPEEGTGWECDKLSIAGSDAQFAGYIGRLAGSSGPLSGLLDGMLMDSWECQTQTWTNDMESEFEKSAHYPLRKWLPAVFGYVIGDQQTTARFLHDWRANIGDLFSNNFYGNMSRLAKENGLQVTYETAAGDIFPADIMEYFKYADVPMCEFWQPISESLVGSMNFKPIKPTASAARLYGKPRVAAEAFTSFELSWDEHLSTLKEVANINSIEGVSHMVFHTYTHNPQTDFLPPGTSFGAGIGTPFLRGQTWWKHMSEFTDYLARCSYMLERGRPVSDVLWYLGDEINHKPDQLAHFADGFKYDYCNPDVLLNRLLVKDGMLVTPEGISYGVLWLPDAPNMLPQTLEKIYSLLCQGATVVGDAPKGLVTLSGGKAAQKRFDVAVRNIWGKGAKAGLREVGKGRLISGMTIDEALTELGMSPDVVGSDALWSHRRVEGADWYFVTAPYGRGFEGTLDFRCSGNVEIWDPVTGTSKMAKADRNGDRTSVKLDLPEAGSCFVVFNHNGEAQASNSAKKDVVSATTISGEWTLWFPAGWGAPASLQLSRLEPWKDLDISLEGRAFSGTVTYGTSFDIDEIRGDREVILDLGRVEMIAVVYVNGKKLRTLWAPPYSLDVREAVVVGKNTLTVEVTSTWFNRLVYDANQPEDTRKTWTISGPSKESPLRDSGLLGPVKLYIEGDFFKNSDSL